MDFPDSHIALTLGFPHLRSILFQTCSHGNYYRLQLDGREFKWTITSVVTRVVRAHEDGSSRCSVNDDTFLKAQKLVGGLPFCRGARLDAEMVGTLCGLLRSNKTVSEPTTPTET